MRFARHYALFVFAGFALAGPVSAADEAGQPASGWSAYFESILEEQPTLGVRYRASERDAVNFAFVDRRNRYETSETRYQQYTVGYRRLFGGGDRRAFADVEVAYGPGRQSDGDKYDYKILRAMVGMEYFLLPTLSIEGRAGLDYQYFESDDDGGYRSRFSTLPAAMLSMSFHF